MEEEVTDFLMVESDEEKTWGSVHKVQSSVRGLCGWRQGSLVVLLECLLEFLSSHSSSDRGLPLLQLMAVKQVKVSVGSMTLRKPLCIYMLHSETVVLTRK